MVPFVNCIKEVASLQQKRHTDSNSVRADSLTIKKKKKKTNKQPEALKSLYRSPGYKKNQLALCKNYVLQW
jgi:hypothetical protein